jgi:hypothetical protein
VVLVVLVAVVQAESRASTAQMEPQTLAAAAVEPALLP